MKNKGYERQREHEVLSQGKTWRRPPGRSGSPPNAIISSSLSRLRVSEAARSVEAEDALTSAINGSFGRSPRPNTRTSRITPTKREGLDAGTTK